MTDEERQLWRQFAASCMGCGLIRDVLDGALIEPWMCGTCEKEAREANMQSYAERQIFHVVAQAIWADAVDIVRRVSDRWGNEVRCHELARATLTALQVLNQNKLNEANATLGIVDGNLWAIEHTWLVYTCQDEIAPRRFILDVYTPGRLPQVQLIDGEHFVVCRGYEPGPVRKDIDMALYGKLLREMQS